MNNITCLIPAHDSAKNARLLGGRPLPSWAVDTAVAAGFYAVLLSDSVELLENHKGRAKAVHLPAAQAREPVLGAVCAWAAEHLDLRADDGVCILCPNVPFRDPGIVRAFCNWAQELGADTAWTAEAPAGRPEFLTWDFRESGNLVPALPSVPEGARLVSMTHYAIYARVGPLLRDRRLRTRDTRLYQLPARAPTMTIVDTGDFEWCERYVRQSQLAS